MQEGGCDPSWLNLSENLECEQLERAIVPCCNVRVHSNLILPLLEINLCPIELILKLIKGWWCAQGIQGSDFQQIMCAGIPGHMLQRPF